MASRLPPAPTGVPPGHAFWNDWYEKLRSLVDQTTTIDWAIITGKPTTLAGYGITDAAPLSHVGFGGVEHPIAVSGGNAGFLSGSDKAKLDIAEVTTSKNAASGYAGLNANTRVFLGTDTTADVILDSLTKGLVLKSANLHYWRASISNAGVVTWTDLGTTKP